MQKGNSTIEKSQFTSFNRLHYCQNKKKNHRKYGNSMMTHTAWLYSAKTAKTHQFQNVRQGFAKVDRKPSVPLCIVWVVHTLHCLPSSASVYGVVAISNSLDSISQHILKALTVLYTRKLRKGFGSGRGRGPLVYVPNEWDRGLVSHTLKVQFTSREQPCSHQEGIFLFLFYG